MSVETKAHQESANDLAMRLATLRELRGAVVPGFTARVREVVVIGSSSRGGSSMLAELMRRSPHLLHLRAEINPFLRLASLGFPDSGTGSDFLDATQLRDLAMPARLVLDRELALDAGMPAESVDDERYALDVAWRFAVQWPGIDFDLARFTDMVCRVIARLRRELRWAPGEIRDVSRVQLDLLCALAEQGLPVNPWYYDIAGGLLRERWPAGPAVGPPGEVLIEEPPFVLSHPWRRADEQDVDTKTLLIKTPSNAYRFGFLRALFPNARLRIIHLTRNPASAINGLYDGWRHSGFHAHRMDAPLRIDGYAEGCEADRWWWKFDLPPDWRQYTRYPLMRVCGFQWRDCHRWILDEVELRGTECVRVPFEDLIRSPASRIACLEELSGWLGIPFDGEFRRAAAGGVGPVMATVAPAPMRWRARADAVIEVIRGPIRDMTERLGYGASDSWI